MRILFAAAMLLCQVLLAQGAWAQGSDSGLIREVTAVRLMVARSLAALQEYTWTEDMQVLVKSKVKSSTTVLCRYDSSGNLIKQPVTTGSEVKPASAISKRPVVRKKADMEDYVQRAITLIHDYVPLKPDRLQYLLDNGGVVMAPSEASNYEFRIKSYFQEEDSLVFAYDPASKALVRIDIVSTLGSAKDPVKVQAVFETLPDGVNRLVSVSLLAKARNVEVRLRNANYTKVAS